MRSGRERLIALGGGVTGELQDTWEGIQRRLREEHEGVHVLCVRCLASCVRCAGGGDKLGAVVCVCRAVCAFNGVTGVGGGWRTSSSPLCQ